MMNSAIAEVCHEANRAYCLAIGDDSQPHWDDAPDWQRESAINGVQFHADNPGSTPEDSHVSWMVEKAQAGWGYGEEKDPEAKTHPCMVPYERLPGEQRRKDSLFMAIVHALSDG